MRNSGSARTVGRRLHATAGEVLRLAGWCALEGGHQPQAQRYWIAALRLQDPSYVRESARRQIKLATVYLRQDQPEVDHAVALATRAMDTLTGQVDSARCVDLVTRFVSQLAPYRRRPAVRQFRDHAATLRTPA